MHASLLLGVATVFVLGLGAQWIAWRFRLPSILLPLFGPAVTFVDLDERFQAGAEVRVLPIADRDMFGHLMEGYDDVVTPLFLARGSSLYVFSQRDSNPTPQTGDRLIAIVGPVSDEDEAHFEEDSLLLTAEAPGAASGAESAAAERAEVPPAMEGDGASAEPPLVSARTRPPRD